MSSKLGVSYSTIVSSYQKITREFYRKIKEQTSKQLQNDKIFYVETTGNKERMKATVAQFHEQYPDDKLIITLDHSLLVEYLDEKSEVELVSEVAKMALFFKKEYGAMVIMLGQLNDKIEQPERINNPLFHFPKKTDLHGSKAIYMITDTLMVIMRPEANGIEYYGKRKWPTEDLIAIHVIKSRLNGTEGVIRLKQDFAHGTLHEWTYEEKQPELNLKED
jgi:hypothetical protein